jgi:hypothetical protein
MNTITTKKPRIRVGILVATTNTARLACMKIYTTYYVFRPISYKIVRQIIIDNPIIA